MFSSIVVIAWIAFNVYQTTITSTISEKVREEILPIKPNFDQVIIDSVKKREQIPSLYQNTVDNVSKAASLSANPNSGDVSP